MPPVLDPQSGFWEGTLDSAHQRGPTRVQVLLPDIAGPDGPRERTWPVLYLLPVEGAQSGKYGHGLAEARRADLANRLGTICVWPEFTSVPWYGDHATDSRIAQESFVLRDLLPWVEAHFPARRDREGRWLLGFSKSGWGAYSLLLRNPQVFGYAAAWDAPFSLDGQDTGSKDWGPLGIRKVMGTKENFQGYLPMRLVREHRVELASSPARLVLGGSDIWVKDTGAMHALLQELGIPHSYRPDLKMAHRWDSGWLAPMAEELATLAGGTGKAAPQ